LSRFEAIKSAAGCADGLKVMQSSVLFVDDEELICHSYRKVCETHLPDFLVETARSAEAGIALLAAQHFDVVVTDLTMPGLDGIEFLAAVNRTQPDAARIIVSAFADRLKVARCLFVAHRYFDKPVETMSLVRLLQQLASFRDIVGNDKVRRIVGGMGSLPGPPEIFLKLQAVLASPSCMIQEVGAVVEQDPAVTAKLLQIVNSAHFGFPYKILDAAHPCKSSVWIQFGRWCWGCTRSRVIRIVRGRNRRRRNCGITVCGWRLGLER
jgi:DNA-binding NarL/FixJ family response regulator